MGLDRAHSLINTIYIAALALPLLARFLAQPTGGVQPSMIKIFGFALFVMAGVDYLIAMWFEARGLSPAQIRLRIERKQVKDAQTAIAMTAILVAALGCAPAIYALVGYMINVPQLPWFWMTWGVSLLAFMRQKSRWERYEVTLRDFDRNS